MAMPMQRAGHSAGECSGWPAQSCLATKTETSGASPTIASASTDRLRVARIAVTGVRGCCWRFGCGGGSRPSRRITLGNPYAARLHPCIELGGGESLTGVETIGAVVVRGFRDVGGRFCGCVRPCCLLRRQIGSAQCRERVCQYVYISVVAVS